MPNQLRISQSKIKDWRQCKFRHHLKHDLKLRPNKKRRPLQFGGIMHAMLEAHADGNDPFKVLDGIDIANARLFDEEKEMYGEIVDDIRHIFTDYLNYWKGQDFIYIRHNKRNAEHKFEIEVESGIVFTGKLDAMGKLPSKKKLSWLIEHKTFNREPSEDHRWRSIQSGVYIRAVDMLGWTHLDGTCWNYIRSKPPSWPEMTQRGQMSRRKIVTLPSVLAEFMREHKLQPQNYQAMIDLVDEQQDEYYRRVFTPISKAVVDDVYRDMIRSAHEIQDRRPKDKPIRTIALHCDWCEYEPICRAEMLNLDVDFVREHEFYVGEEGDHYEPAIGIEP
jgi:hypothetical protein